MKKLFISGMITTVMVFGGCTTVFAATLPNTSAAKTITTTSTTYTAVGSSIGIVNSPIGLYMRDEASLDGNIIMALDYGSKVNIEGTVGDWYKVIVDGYTGYVYSEYVTTSATIDSSSSTSNSMSGTSSTATSSEYGVVSNLNYGYTLNFRIGPSTSSYIIGSLTNGTKVQILDESNGWYNIEYNGEIGYVYGEFITLTNSSSTTSSSNSSSRTASNSTSNTSVTAQEIINYAEQFDGYSYVWGGASPSTGFDCSGLVQYVFGHFGIKLPRTTYEQVNCGTAVSLSDIQPGDLVFEIGTAQDPQHVGIYIGDGKILNAMDPSSGVTITPLYQVVAVRNIL